MLRREFPRYFLLRRKSLICLNHGRTKYTGSGTLADSWIARCDDFPDEVRGWESVCIMTDGIVPAKLSPQGTNSASTIS